MSEPLLCGVLTLTPTHCGTGQAAGAVDLPIAREVHTGFPVLPASTLKGVVRDWFHQDSDTRYLFGPPPPKRSGQSELDAEISGDADLEAGALVFLEGMLLAFPVRSLTGVFRWVTSPMLISRLRRVLAAFGSERAQALKCPEPHGNQILLPSGQEGPVSLEDLVFSADRCLAREEVDALARQLGSFVAAAEDHPDRLALTRRLVVAPDEVLQDLTRRATAVTARIVLDPEKKTSENLWYEETLPPDTLFAVVIADRPGSNKSDKDRPVVVLKRLLNLGNGHQGTHRYTQIGGNVTVGQGMVRWLFDVEVA